MENITIQDIEKIVREVRGITKNELRQRTKQHPIAHARGIIYYFCLKHGVEKGNLRILAEAYGLTHSSVLNQRKRIQNFIDTKDPDYYDDIIMIGLKIMSFVSHKHDFTNIPQF